MLQIVNFVEQHTAESPNTLDVSSALLKTVRPPHRPDTNVSLKEIILTGNPGAYDLQKKLKDTDRANYRLNFQEEFFVV